MKWLRVGLDVIGAASLLLAVGFGASIIYSSMSSGKENKATRKDVLFILNSGGISTDQDYKIISSYQSPRSFTGDHIDYFCIELPKFEVTGPLTKEWHDGPENDPLLAEALKMAIDDAHQRGGGVPSIEEANSAAIKVMFPLVVLRDRHVNEVEILLYDPQKKMLFYVSSKT
jgi:hypothetical protein